MLVFMSWCITTRYDTAVLALACVSVAHLGSLGNRPPHFLFAVRRPLNLAEPVLHRLADSGPLDSASSPGFGSF